MVPDRGMRARTHAYAHLRGESAFSFEIACMPQSADIDQTAFASYPPYHTVCFEAWESNMTSKY